MESPAAQAGKVVMTEQPRFVFAGRVVELGSFDPTVSVLHWLRSQGRNGAKEGCGGGRCGACTVVVGELDDG
ncbi:2Fe-2S iron-sulfur cluster binding domain-containing protein, partial [bacterium]|nr:2Fe-2S iron-sulfur cluster binding domain-containing protein [bacterium]